MSTEGGREGATRLTEEQARPLAVRGSSVSLSAGAGCGKTTVLKSRFLDSLEGAGHPLRSLVALTFTERAARELRKRIRGACHDRLAAARGEDVGRLRSVLRGLEAAPISTFHEYCAGLLRRHALAAGIDPDFRVLDEAIAGSIREEALTRCVRRWLAEENEDLIELAVEYGLKTVRDSIDELVGRRAAGELAEWVGLTEDDVFARWRAVWERDGRKTLYAPVARAARGCADWLGGNELDHPKLKAFRADLLAALPDAATPIGNDRLAELRALTLLPRGLKAEQWPSAAVNEACKGVVTALRDAVDKFLERGEPDEAVSRRCAANGLRLVRLAAEARGAYDDAKRERGGLDFDDLLARTRDLLRVDAAAVREFPGHPVGSVLVDEFQDTDPVQSEILRGLCGEGFATGRLFVVGDFKQSIYRFRGAVPKIFEEYRDAFPEGGRHDLTENFRSAAGVIDFVNALFAKAFAGETPRLVPGPHARPASEGPAVEFVWAEELTEDETKKGPNVDVRRRVEARWLARLIRTRLHAGWPIRDRGTKQVRNAHEGDVAFLFRAMTDLAAYEHALQAEGLDFHVVGGKAFYAQQEIQDLVNVLSVVEDPLDAASLAGALRGPFFGVSDVGLFWLGGGPTAHGDLTAGLAGCEAVSGLSEADRRSAARARSLLGRWRGLKDRVPIAALVDRVLDESGFEAALLGEFLGDRKRANARKLVRLARRYDDRGGFTLGHFVAKLRADLREPPREEQASTTEEEGRSVRLMSIHQAKGLEFPIVVVPDLNRKQDPGRKAVAFHPELGPLVRPGRSTVPEVSAAEGDRAEEDGSGRSLGLVTFEAIERVEDEAEAVRLFYVATTRARDALILSAGVGPCAKAESPALRLLSERFDRRTGGCLEALPEGWNVPRVRVTTELPPVPVSTGPRGHKRRPRLRAVARLIESARSTPRLGSDAEPFRPRYVDLDAARVLPPRAARLDRLVRSILADPRALRDGKGALADAARLAGRRQEPVAHPDLVAEAVQALAPWAVGPLGKDIARAGAVERGLEWSVAWPTPSTAPTVFQGRAEFLFRDGGGSWRAVVFSPPGASTPVERLRLLLAARAAEAMGFGPVVQGWLVRLGGGLSGEESFAEDVIQAAVGEALAALAPPGQSVPAAGSLGARPS